MDAGSLSRRSVLRYGGTAGLLGVSGCLRLTGSTDNGSAADDGGAGDSSSTRRPLAASDSATLAFHHTLDGDFSDQVNDVAGTPATGGLRFVDDRGGTVLELDGDSATDDEGYYTFSYDDLGEHIDRGAPMTIALWVKPTNNQGWERTITAGPVLDTRNGNLRFRRWNPDRGRNDFVIQVDAELHVPNSRWTHLIGTVERNGQARLYVDGERVGATATDDLSETLGGYLVDSDRGSVGHIHSGRDGGYDAHFGGRVDDVRVYEGLFDDQAAQQLYDAVVG